MLLLLVFLMYHCSALLHPVRLSVILSMQTPLFYPRSNAEDNFIGALLMASCYSKNLFLQQVSRGRSNSTFPSTSGQRCITAMSPSPFSLITPSCFLTLST